MHFLARNILKFKFHNKETHNCNITTSAANHIVRYGVRSELCLTLQHNRGVREYYERSLTGETLSETMNTREVTYWGNAVRNPE